MNELTTEIIAALGVNGTSIRKVAVGTPTKNPKH